ncbi:MAG: arginyltransferase [Pseudomonadota bacterium]
MKENDALIFNPPEFARRLKFYLTSPQPCPYLPGKKERKVFANLAVDGAVSVNDSLTRSGFRRSQTIVYRPACASCSECRSVRIDVANFKWSKRWRRVANRSKDMVRSPRPAAASREQFRLLKKYLDHRHEDGGMTEMTLRDYAGMVDASPVRTVVFEYRAPPEPGEDEGKLIAAALTDVMRDGLSMVYSFFDPAFSDRSLGSFMILDHIRLAKELELPYVYLGYWVRGSEKMGYKAAFRPFEIFDGQDWRTVADNEY